MIKVNFRYYQDYSKGGKGSWKTSFRLFDDDIKVKDLEDAIAEELKKTESGYISHKKVTTIERI